MSRKEIQKLCLEIGLLNDHCTERDCSRYFLFSKASHINEYDTESPTNHLYFVEFLEAFARIADKSS